jgi:hypothetical protein
LKQHWTPDKQSLRGEAWRAVDKIEVALVVWPALAPCADVVGAQLEAACSVVADMSVALLGWPASAAVADGGGARLEAAWSVVANMSAALVSWPASVADVAGVRFEAAWFVVADLVEATFEAWSKVPEGALVAWRAVDKMEVALVAWPALAPCADVVGARVEAAWSVVVNLVKGTFLEKAFTAMAFAASPAIADLFEVSFQPAVVDLVEVVLLVLGDLVKVEFQPDLGDLLEVEFQPALGDVVEVEFGLGPWP